MTAKIKSAMTAVTETNSAVKAVVVASGRIKDSIDRIVAGGDGLGNSGNEGVCRRQAGAQNNRRQVLGAGKVAAAQAAHCGAPILLFAAPVEEAGRAAADEVAVILRLQQHSAWGSLSITKGSTTFTGLQSLVPNNESPVYAQNQPFVVVGPCTITYTPQNSAHCLLTIKISPNPNIMGVKQ